jgi:hypothetical protein
VVAGSLLSALWVYPAFLLADVAGSTGLVVGVTVALGVLMLQYGVLPALLATQFPVEVRYTGISMCFQISAVLGGGLLPILAGSLVSRADGHYAPAATLMVLAGAASCVGALLCLGSAEARRSDGYVSRPEGRDPGTLGGVADSGEDG